MTSKEQTPKSYHQCSMTWYFAGVLSLITAVLLFIGTNVVANDRIRESEDKRIQSDCRMSQYELRKELGLKIDKLTDRIDKVLEHTYGRN